MQCFFLGWIFAAWLENERRCKRHKGFFFFWEKMIPSCHIMRKKNLKSPYLKNTFQQVGKIYEES